VTSRHISTVVLQIELTLRCLVALGLISCLPAFAERAHAPDPSTIVHIGVLGLFHPTQLTVRPTSGALVLEFGDEQIVLETSSGNDSATIRISGNATLVSIGTQVVRASKVRVTGRMSDPAEFVLSIPGKISRHYHGTLEIKPIAGTLSAVVAMDREAAVASIVAAENPPDTPLEALKAQAVAARSYLTAGRGRHYDFDFCDTTHCQFLREVPAPASAAAKGAADTRDLVLVYDSHPFAAMYTRSCNGRTRTPAEVGLPSATYSYYSVECKYCREHPAQWSSQISAQDAATLHASDESARLKLARRLGWATIPSNDFVARADHDQIILHGTGEGHGIGFCQSGAKAMAEEGADFRQILSHYYPNTTIVSWPVAVSERQHSE
jgi:stage II sporulation protein D (peptidoglycan lytic transglycosylase)